MEQGALEQEVVSPQLRLGVPVQEAEDQLVDGAQPGQNPAKINVNREREVEENEEPRFQINENSSPKEQKELKQVLERYGDLFSSRLGRTNLAKHRIDTEDAKPIKHKPYRVSAKERGIIKDQIDEMLTEGIIRPSSSPWSFPVILVKKRDGKYRFCVDYRKLNNVTVKYVYSIPRIDETSDLDIAKLKSKKETKRKQLSLQRMDYMNST
ncbi:hypothetical protein LAZ67_12001112 [Cordylochernes scorpioides]|uniref:Transposon Ty3-I Gag-Pol polyprotein n=1 Tax=Cordylochernes scorpioides TaxID=51811 RepID=A0ABY6L1I2_9ARAC|nr:hypothetical protein LAZ67_12001112 [Cordylochernes scorpioides]